MLEEEAPELDSENLQAIALWNLLGGYHLERLPYLSGLVRVQDWEDMLERLRAIDGAQNEPMES